MTVSALCDEAGGSFDSPGAPCRGAPAAERACDFVFTKLRAGAGRLVHQGARIPPLPCRSTSPAVRLFAEQRLRRISTSVARALVVWADGFPVELLSEVPLPAHVLALQARGRRCVSILPDGAPTAPHENSLAFTLHDLGHLDKFANPEHHAGQVGFFSSLHRAVQRPAWQQFECDFDAAFRADVDHVGADMNGSAVFLFAVLKMKLKMAVRRRSGARSGGRPIDCGPLTEDEASAFRAAENELLCLLDLPPAIAAAACAVSAKHDDPAAALRLLRYFEQSH